MINTRWMHRNYHVACCNTATRSSCIYSHLCQSKQLCNLPAETFSKSSSTCAKWRARSPSLHTKQCAVYIVASFLTNPFSKGRSPLKQARKLQATLEGCNPKLCPATDSLTGVRCRATSVAKNIKSGNFSLFYLKAPNQSLMPLAVTEKTGIRGNFFQKRGGLRSFHAYRIAKYSLIGMFVNQAAKVKQINEL